MSLSREELKLQAFQILDGWGVDEPQPDGTSKFRAWNLVERMEKADELVAWALDEKAENEIGREKR